MVIASLLERYLSRFLPQLIFFPPPVHSSIQFFMLSIINFMTLFDIMYIFRQFTIQFNGTIALSFLLSIHAIATLFCLVLLSLRMCSSLNSRWPVPLVTLWHHFLFLGKHFTAYKRVINLLPILCYWYFPHIIGRHVIDLLLLQTVPFGGLFGSEWSVF